MSIVVLLHEMSSIVQFMSTQLDEQLATLNCLKFTFSEGRPKLARGTSFGCQNWSGQTDFGGGLIFSLQGKL